MIEYDEQIEQELIKNNFTHTNIIKLLNNLIIKSIKISNQSNEIEMLKCKYKVGCIFTLPGSRRNGLKYIYYTDKYIYYTELSKNNLLKILKLKTFL